MLRKNAKERRLLNESKDSDESDDETSEDSQSGSYNESESSESNEAKTRLIANDSEEEGMEDLFTLKHNEADELVDAKELTVE